MWRSTRFTSGLLAALTLAVAGVSAPQHEHHRHARKRYTRSLAGYAIPEVSLVSSEGAVVAVPAVLNHDGPVLLQFIFTTCPTICPAMSGAFSGVQNQLGGDVERVRMVSISIDPEHDTPARLRDYAERFHAGSQWILLSGKLEDVEAVQKAFDAYRGNKMRHEPITFLRGSPEDRWLRLNGLMSAAELVAEYRQLIGQ